MYSTWCRHVVFWFSSLLLLILCTDSIKLQCLAVGVHKHRGACGTGHQAKLPQHLPTIVGLVRTYLKGQKSDSFCSDVMMPLLPSFFVIPPKHLIIL